MNKALYLERIKSLKLQLSPLGVDAILIDHPIDLFYLTGAEVSVGHLLIHNRGSRFFVDGRYIEEVELISPIPVKLTTPEAIPKYLSQKSCGDIKKIGFDSATTPYQRYEQLKQIVKKTGRPILLKPLPSPLSSKRIIKDREELQKLRRAAKLGTEGFNQITSLLKEGVTELEIAAELEIFWRRKGASGAAFDPIIAFGKNSSKPHYTPKNKKLKKGDPILIDIGVTLDHYHSDMTRVLFMNKPTQKMKDIYETVLEAQLNALELCKPGTSLEELDQAARQTINKRGFGAFFTHSLGHGIGLEVHEEPFFRKQKGKKKALLQPGMVLTIEPGVYLPNIGGVRIEDTVIINDKGHENLTKAPKELCNYLLS